MPSSNTLFLHRGLRWSAVVLLAGATGLLWYGLTLPIIHVEKFWFFDNTVSIWSGMRTLYAKGEIFLGTVLLVFSILFPIGKNFLLAVTLLKGARMGVVSQRLVRWSAVLGKWSMLDVFIVAILVASVRLGALAEASVLSALYFFAASVIVTNLTSTALDWWIRLRGAKAFYPPGSAESA